MYPRRYLGALGTPGIAWVALFVGLAVYGLVATAAGTLDPLLFEHRPAWNPLDWNLSALRAAALHGAGIVLQPEVLLSHDLEAGRLEAVLPQWSYKPTPMHLIYAPDRRPTAMLRSAIDFLVARFG